MLDIIFSGLFNCLKQIWWVIPIILLLTIIRTSYFKGWFGEKMVSLAVSRIAKEKNGVLLNNIMLPTENGTTQIDHILFLPSGIFVIETKNMKGWIFGDSKSKNWTQQIYKHRSTFQNPLHQNYKHTMTIKNILDVNDDVMHSVIVFVGAAVFKTTKPENIYNISQLRKLLKEESVEKLSTEQIYDYSQGITTTKLDNTFSNNRNHVKHLKEKYESINTCPKCNSSLVERVVKNGDNKGNTFFGCSSFPKCKYIKK